MSVEPRLSVIEGTPTASEREAYNAFLVRGLEQRASALLQHDDWDAAFLARTLRAGIPVPRGEGFLKRFPPFVFRGPEILRNELKLYVATALLDPRHASYKWWYDRRPLFDFIVQDWPSLQRQFRAECLADIETPLRPQSRDDYVTHIAGSNRELQRTYAAWFCLNVDHRITQKRTWATCSSEAGVETHEFPGRTHYDGR